MACQNCKSLEGCYTSKEDAFEKTFLKLTSYVSGLVETGTAECKSCQQKVAFEFDDTLISKLRVSFL